MEEEVRKKLKKMEFYKGCLVSLIDIIEEEIEDLKPNLPFGNIRFVAEIENKNKPDRQIKSPQSIVEKIKRNKNYTLENFIQEMPDIFRDRIICNYLSDIKAIVEKIKSSKKIKEKFSIVENKDRIYEIRKKDPAWAKGVRAHYFVFKPKEEPKCPKIEIQIMTMLSYAWDKKDHYLIYERERKGIKVSPLGKIRMKAMSELLYVADEYFDSIQKELSKEKLKGG